MKTKKHIICSLLFSINIICSAQINNFWGVKFGSTINEAKTVMNSKSNLKEYVVVKNALFYKPPVGSLALFASQPIKGITLNFYENKFYKAFIRLGDDTYTLNSFNRIEANLIKKYGNPTKITNDTNFSGYERVWIDGDNSITLKRILKTSLLDLTYERKTHIPIIKKSDMNDL